MNSFFHMKYLLAGVDGRRGGHLYRLADHCDKRIRQHVAENNSCPADLLALLAEDLHPDVRMAVALNMNTSIESRLRLARDPCPDVRYRIASTSYMPTAVLTILLADENPHVQARAKTTLQKLRDGSVQEVQTK